jgi:hypothetical protein
VGLADCWVVRLSETKLGGVLLGVFNFGLSSQTLVQLQRFQLKIGSDKRIIWCILGGNYGDFSFSLYLDLAVHF